MAFKIGGKAPNFKLEDKNQQIVELYKLDKDFIVVYFYPKDNTPGCTIEANEFTDFYPKFKKLNVEIIGISGGNHKSKEKFCSKYNINIPLLSDPDFKIAEKYESYGEKFFMGRNFLGLHRKTYILDRNFKLIFAFEKVKAKGHANEVYEKILELKNN